MNTNDKDTLTRLWRVVRADIECLPSEVDDEYAPTVQAWLNRLRDRAHTPIAGDDKAAVRFLDKLESELTAHGITVTYDRPVGPDVDPHATGMLNTGLRIMFVERREPIQMLYTMLHETTHAFINGTHLCYVLSEDGQEVVADATACLVLSRLGFDAIPHCAAYVAPYVCGDGRLPMAYNDFIEGFADTIEGRINPW